MKKIFSKKSAGFVSVIVIALLVVFSIMFLFGSSFIGIESKKSSDDFFKKDKAKYLAFACAQDALLKLKNNASYAGNEINSVDSDSCQTLVIQNLGGEQRVIRTQSTIDIYTKKIQVDVSALTPVMMISSWNESPNF